MTALYSKYPNPAPPYFSGTSTPITQLTQFLKYVDGELLRLIPFHEVRFDMLLGKIAGSIGHLAGNFVMRKFIKAIVVGAI